MRPDKMENFTLVNLRKVPKTIKRIIVYRLDKNGNRVSNYTRQFVDPITGTDFFMEYARLSDTNNIRRIWLSVPRNEKYKNGEVAESIRWILMRDDDYEVYFEDLEGKQYHIEDFKGVTLHGYKTTPKKSTVPKLNFRKML